jgi:Ca2+-binding RTX toxin-like protein
LRLEQLEKRQLLDASSVLAEVEFTIRTAPDEPLEQFVTWTVEGNDQDNVIVVRQEGDFLTVEIDGQRHIGPPSRDVHHVKVLGHAGNDVISIDDSVPQTTRLEGGQGDDTVVGSLQNDTIIGGWGNDTLYGRHGNDQIYGDLMRVEQGLSPVTLASTAVNRAVRPPVGGVVPPAADVIWGGAGDDMLFGDTGDDQLYGEVGKDLLRGGSGNDLLKGGVGDDRLVGDSGTDTMVGGHGADRINARDGEIDYIFPDEDDQLDFDRGLDIFPLEQCGAARQVASHDTDRLWFAEG